jgi:hypothetical protein
VPPHRQSFYHSRRGTQSEPRRQCGNQSFAGAHVPRWRQGLQSLVRWVRFLPPLPILRRLNPILATFCESGRKASSKVRRRATDGPRGEAHTARSNIGYPHPLSQSILLTSVTWRPISRGAVLTCRPVLRVIPATRHRSPGHDVKLPNNLPESSSSYDARQTTAFGKAWRPTADGGAFFSRLIASPMMRRCGFPPHAVVPAELRGNEEEG